MKTTSLHFTKSRSLACVFTHLLTAAISQAQQPPGTRPLIKPADSPSLSQDQTAENPFDLDFEGGVVTKFVGSVEAASKEPFNVIIPESAKDLQIPPVRVRGVTLSRLLSALSMSSTERKAIVTSRSSNSRVGAAAQNVEYHDSSFSFTPTSGNGGAMVWQLVVNKPVEIPAAIIQEAPVARFYQLKSNLEAGVKVEDITTVAQTAWKMMKLDEKDIPELKVHDETGILIAGGKIEALQVLDSILQQLPRAGVKNPGSPAPAIPSPQGIVPPTPAR